MAFEHKENTATVFANDKKSADNQPDYTGKGKVGDELEAHSKKQWKRVLLHEFQGTVREIWE